jgi:hypothetical protein
MTFKEEPMRRPIVILAAVLAAAAVTASVLAQTPGETPFPAPQITGVFVTGQTVTAPGSSLGAGVLANYFPQGSSVVFRAFAGATKTGAILTDEDVTYAYVSIPGQPNLKLAYGEDQQWPWTATWTVPADYPLGTVQFKVLFKTKTKQYGSFIQIPVATSRLIVTKAQGSS